MYETRNINKKKIELLIISLQAIDTLYINNPIPYTNNKRYNLNYNKIDYLIQLKKSRNGYNQILLHYFIDIVNYIFILHKNVNTLLLDNITNDLIRDYLKHKHSNRVKKYLKKFHYIYFSQDKYYKTFKSINYSYRINVDKIALINLYIITKLKSKRGIYILIKYLDNDLKFI
uniref:Uncharacterized protein n=1 Tax=Chondria sp. (in: red algae) TaxID=1982705 RepID=A0A1Z1MDJ8_9FLOR|nr:hypothetical protein [Chondria sp. (in: red algae)]